MTDPIHDTMNQTKAVFAEWKKVADEQWARWETVMNDMGRFQKQGVEQVGVAIDEVARMMKGSVEQASQIAEELRKAATEASKRARETVAAMGASGGEKK